MTEHPLLELANTEMQAGNIDQALIHFESALAANPRLAQAWSGKGVATARRCLRKDIKLPGDFIDSLNQSLHYLDKGLEVATPGEREQLRDYIADEIINVVTKAHEDLFELLRDCGLISRGLHKPISLACIQAALWVIDKRPENLVAMKALVAICGQDLAGFDYDEITIWGDSKVHQSMDKDDKELRNEIISKYLPIIRMREPEFNYVWESGSASKDGIDSRCFIATACYGSESEEVQRLRTFRDYILMSSRLGRFMVDCYYRTSPPIAAIIHSRPRAKFFCRLLMIRPLLSVAECMLSFSGHLQ